MKVVYLAGPYRAASIWGIVQNIRAAEAVAIELWRMGLVPLCPHLNSALFDGVVPTETFLRGDLELLRRCDAIVLLPDWEKSVGARQEAEEARRLALPDYHWPEDRDLLEQLGDQPVDPVLDRALHGGPND